QAVMNYVKSLGFESIDLVRLQQIFAANQLSSSLTANKIFMTAHNTLLYQAREQNNPSTQATAAILATPAVNATALQTATTQVSPMSQRASALLTAAGTSTVTDISAVRAARSRRGNLQAHLDRRARQELDR